MMFLSSADSEDKIATVFVCNGQYFEEIVCSNNINEARSPPLLLSGKLPAYGVCAEVLLVVEFEEIVSWSHYKDNYIHIYSVTL